MDDQEESEAESKELEQRELKESNDRIPQKLAKEESVIPSVTLKQCFISIEKLKMSDSESNFDSDEDLPPLFTMTTRSSKPKSKKSAKELMEEQESLAKGIKVDDISIDNIKETIRRLEFVPSPEMDDTSLSEEPETNEEKSISIFCSNGYLQYFHISDVSFFQCGYDSTSEKLTVFEKEMLSFSRVELEHVLSSFLLISNLNCISDYKSFVTFLLRNISAHNDIACVEACYNMLTVLLEKHPDVKSLNFSNSEIFMLLFNYGTEIDDFKFLSRKPDFVQCLREESAKKNKSHSDIPENWMFNFKFIMIAITNLINNCQFEVKELCSIIIYFLWMSLDSALLQENLFSTMRECIVVSLDQIPSDKWPRVMREVAWTFVTMSFPSKNQKWNNIYHIAQSMPITSERGAELRKYIAFLSLTALGKERISSKESKTMNGFSLGELQSLLQKIVQMNSDLTSSFAAKFLNLCISRLKTNDEDFMELCSILKYVESALTEECHEAKSRFMKIHARLKIPYGKNSAYKLSTEDKKKWSFAIKQETDQDAVGQKSSDEATIQPIHLVKVKLEPDSSEQCADKIISFSEFDCENEEDDDLDFDYFDKLSENSSAVSSVKVKSETTSDSESNNVEGKVPFISNMPSSSLDSLVLPMDISSNVCGASTVCDSKSNMAESPTENIPIIGNIESLNVNMTMSLEVNRNTSIDVCNERVNNELNIVQDSLESQEKNASGLTVGAGFDDESPKGGANVIIKSETEELDEPEKEESCMDISANGPVISVADTLLLADEPESLVFTKESECLEINMSDTLLLADEPESVVFTKESECPEINMSDSKNKELLTVLPEKNLGEGSSQLHQSNESNASATDDLSSVNNSGVHVIQSITVDDSSTKNDETFSDFYKSLGLPPGIEISPVKANTESTVRNDLPGPSSVEVEISSDKEVEIIDEKYDDPEVEVLLVTPPKSKSKITSGILEDSFNKLEQSKEDKDEEIMIVTELKNEADKTRSSVIISTSSGSKYEDIDNGMTVINKEDSVNELDSASEIKPSSSLDENLVKIGDETLQIGSKNSLLEKAVEFYCKDICDMSLNKDNMAASSKGTSVSIESKQILAELFGSHPESFVSNDSKIMDEVSAVMNEAIDVVKDLKSAALAEQSPEFSSPSVLATAIVNKDEEISNVMSEQNSIGNELLLENVKELECEKVGDGSDTERHASTLSGELSKSKVSPNCKRKLSFTKRRSICDNVKNESSPIDHSNDENGVSSEISGLLDDLLKSPVLLNENNKDISKLSKYTNSSQNIQSSISPLSSVDVNQNFSCNTHQSSNNSNLETLESVQNVSSLKKRTRNENDLLQSSVLDYFSPAKKVSLGNNTKSPVLHSVSKSNSHSPVKRKSEFSSPSSKVPKHSASVLNENSVGRHSHHTKSSKNKSSKSPSKHSPKKSPLSAKVLSSKKSPVKFFDYKQKRISYVKSPRKKLLSKRGLHLINILQEKPPTSTSNQQRSTKKSNTDVFVLSDSDSDVIELYCDPKRYKDKECMVIYESEEVVVIDSD